MIRLIENSVELEYVSANLMEREISYGFIPFDPISKDSRPLQLLLVQVKYLRKELAKAGFSDDSLAIRGNDVKYLSQNSAEVIIPAALFSFKFLIENPNLISIYLSIVSNFATDALKGIIRRTKKNEVKLSLVIKDEFRGKLLQFDYEGPVDKIESIDLVSIINSQDEI